MYNDYNFLENAFSSRVRSNKQSILCFHHTFWKRYLILIGRAVTKCVDEQMSVVYSNGRIAVSAGSSSSSIWCVWSQWVCGDGQPSSSLRWKTPLFFPLFRVFHRLFARILQGHLIGFCRFTDDAGILGRSHVREPTARQIDLVSATLGDHV